MYLFGRSSNLYIDHWPLTSIFHTRKSILVVTAARLQRYALFLAGVDYTTEYKNAKVHSNAAGLSRLPLVRETRDKEIVDPVGVFSLMQFDPLPVTVENVRRETQSEILFWLRCMKCPVKDGRTTLILHSTPILFVKTRSHHISLSDVENKSHNTSEVAPSSSRGTSSGTYGSHEDEGPNPK